MKMKMKNYTRIPNELLGPSQLTIIERYLLSVLLKYCRQKDHCFPSQKTLAADLNVSSRYIRTLLTSLVQNGLLVSTRLGWNRANTYEVAKQFTNDRNSSSAHIGSTFPLHKGTVVPPKNTYGKSQTKRTQKGMQKLKEVMERSGIRSRLASNVRN